MLRGLLLFILFVLCSQQKCIAGPTTQIDSVQQIIDGLSDSKEKVDELVLLSVLQRRNVEYDLAVSTADKAIEIAEEFNYQKGLGKAFRERGMALEFSGNFSEAQKSYSKALEKFIAIDDKLNILDQYMNLGISFWYLGNFPNAIDNYFNCLAIAIEVGDTASMGNCYNNMGAIYNEQGEREKAIQQYLEGKKLYEIMSDTSGIATSYNNIAGVYIEEEPYKALGNYLKSIELRETANITKSIGSSYNNLGNCYLNIANDSLTNANAKDSLHVLAWNSFKKGREIQIKQGDRRGLIYSMGGYGSVYLKRNQVDSAVVWFRKALEVAVELKSLKEEVSMRLNLSEALKKKGSYEEALMHYEIYKSLSDSIFSEDKSTSMAAAELRFEFEFREQQREQEMEHEKEIKAEIDALENRRKENVLLAISLGLFASLVLAVILFQRFRISKNQNVIIEKQKLIVDEKNQSLTDSISYAQLIQQAILTSEEYFAKTFIEHFIFHLPKDVVSGDFYWAYKTKNNKKIWAVVDCTGHGVPGAFMSMIGNTFLNEIVVENKIEEPDEILNRLREQVGKSLGQGEGAMSRNGMDIALCSIENGMATFSGGFNELIHISDGKLTSYKADRFAISYSDGEQRPFTKHQFPVKSNDMIYLFSDGFIDQFGGVKGKKFKIKQFKELLLSVHSQSSSQQHGNMEKTFNEWKGEMEQTDDVCVVGVRV